MATSEIEVLQKTKTFYRKFYRFPNYIYVGGCKFDRDSIIGIVERLIGKPFQWYKRRKMFGQLDDALRLLQQA